MANEIYLKYKQDILSGTADRDLIQTTAGIAPFCALVGTYTIDNTLATGHEFYTSLTDVRGTDQQITSNSVNAAGTFISTAVLTYTAVTSGTAINYLVIYRKNAGASSTWALVMKWDTATGLPVTPNGGNITVTWPATPVNGNIFTI